MFRHNERPLGSNWAYLMLVVALLAITVTAMLLFGQALFVRPEGVSPFALVALIGGVVIFARNRDSDSDGR